jgi:cbb3-type cytochrome oxidase maturation protein
MSVLYIVLPLAILFALGAVLTFIWATRDGQFDDLDTARLRMLHDDAPARPDSKRGMQEKER